MIDQQYEVPPVETSTEDDGDDDNEYGVWASIGLPDGTNVTARISLPPDASAGALAKALIQVSQGAAATFGNGVPDQVGMRIVDPDGPASPLRLGAGLSVDTVNKLLKQATEMGSTPEQVRMRIDGRTVFALDALAVLKAAGVMR